MSPVADDAALTLLSALRDDFKTFREEWQREMKTLVTQAVFESEMKRRDDHAASLQSAIDREASARGDFVRSLATERKERQATVRWLVGLMGTPLAGLVINQLWHALQK